MRTFFVVPLLLAVACGAPPSPPPPPTVAIISPPVDASPPDPVDAGTTAAATAPSKKSDDPFAALPPSLSTDMPNGPAKPLKRSGTTWPFHKWDRAESVVLNWAPYGPQSSLRVYDAAGWSKDVKYRAPLDTAAAKRSVDLVLEGHGELLVSKCAVPRHAVVLYDGDVEVASINVCFTCHDLLLWPQWPAKSSEDQLQKAPKMAEEVLPRWRRLFVDDLHFPLWTQAP